MNGNNFTGRCRLCANTSLTLLKVEVTLSERINTLFQVRIGSNETEDKLPRWICTDCSATVTEAWTFLEKVHMAQRDLLDVTMLQEDVKIDITEYPLAVNEKPEEVDDDADDGDNETEEEIVSEETESVDWDRSDGWDRYPWNCNQCGDTYTSADELRNHPCVVTQVQCRYFCVDCPKVYTKYTMFIAHVTSSHRPHLRRHCDICLRWFPGTRAQFAHRAHHHADERPYECAVCGKRFRMQSTLGVHARSHMPSEEKNRYECDQCEKRFGTKPNLVAHKKIHAGVRDYTCDQCGKSFIQKGNLDNHLLTHISTRPFSCSICNKTFKTVVRLRKHTSVHSGLKPHKCDICGRQFRERGTLKEHHRIHTGAMPFSCEWCGKTFRFKGVLTTHRRQHTGERPYSCLECQHHFTNWPNYNKHMIRRHGVNTSVSVRKPAVIPPTGMPQRNPPGSVLAPPQLPTPQITELSTTPTTAAAAVITSQICSGVPTVVPTISHLSAATVLAAASATSVQLQQQVLPQLVVSNGDLIVGHHHHHHHQHHVGGGGGGLQHHQVVVVQQSNSVEHQPVTATFTTDGVTGGVLDGGGTVGGYYLYNISHIPTH